VVEVLHVSTRRRVVPVAGDGGAAIASGMEFVGRVDPVQKLRGWLAGEGLRSPVSIVSVSGPGGIGKTFLLEQAIRTCGIEGRNYLRLRLAGVVGARTLGQMVCQDLLQSCTQVDVTSKGYFTETRKNLEFLRLMDGQARDEVEARVSGDPVLKQTVLEVFRAGAGVQAALPFLKKYVDVTKVKEEHLDAVLGLLEKTSAYAQEERLWGGFFPDLRGAGRRNRLRAAIGATLAEGLVGDLAAILSCYQDADKKKPMPQKVAGLDRLLLVIDDFESIADEMNPFLAENLVPKLARAGVDTLIVVLGRDRLSDTDSAWKQHHASILVGELRLAPFSREEGEALVRSSGITDESVVARLVGETACYPYLLMNEIEAELDGGSTALGLKNFFDRTTRWMTPVQRKWLVPICFLDEINEESIASMLPGDDAGTVLEWFKKEASVRSPTATRWEVLPIIRSRLCAYCKLDSPKRYRELQERGAAAAAAAAAVRPVETPSST
jgi:hypothetical protein